MKNNNVKIITIVLMIASVLSSCVSSKKFADTNDKLEQYQDKNLLLQEDNQSLTVSNNELNGQNEQLLEKIKRYEKELEDLKASNQDFSYKNERAKRIQSELEQQIDLLKKGSSDEISQLLAELQKFQEDLQLREDKVRNAEKTLQEQQARLLELEEALKHQKEAVANLKKKVYDALLGYHDQGLTITEKNGKVYVSLDEKLLFKTGSYSVDPKGQQALNKLADVLGKNSDINITVEGHTDDVPLKGTSQIKDNWDLSVMRATAVVKILTANPKVDPKRIIASGRSEFVPVAEGKTADARQKNRRTEIILMPDLSEIFQMLESN